MSKGQNNDALALLQEQTACLVQCYWPIPFSLYNE